MRDTCPTCQAPLDVDSAALTVVACPRCSAPFLAEPSADVRAGPVALPPEFFQRYKFERQLGSGAMGTVMLATEIATGEKLAIKFLIRHDDPQQLKRFMREGKLMAQLSHENVVRVREIGEIAGYPFLAQEYVPGGSLRDLIRGGKRVEVSRALSLMADVFAGLAVCHEAEIVHRDLKPENVLIDPKGHAKLADLGIARDAGTPGSTLTKTGVMIGTPLYMSPEQIVGDRGTAASDLYSGGLVLYELIVGTNPMAAPTLQEVFRRQCDLAPRTLEELGITAPAGISDLLAKLLAKRPEDRPASAGEVTTALRDAAQRARAAASPASASTGALSRAGLRRSGSSSQKVPIPKRASGTSGSPSGAASTGASTSSVGAFSLSVGPSGETGERLRRALILATVIGVLLLVALQLLKRKDPAGEVKVSAPDPTTMKSGAATDVALVPVLDFRVRSLERALLVHFTTPRPVRVRASASEEGSEGGVRASAATSAPAFVHRLVLEDLRPSMSYRVSLEGVGDAAVRFAPRVVRTASEGDRARALGQAKVAGEGNTVLGGGALAAARAWSDLWPLRRWGEGRDLNEVLHRLDATTDAGAWQEGMTILRWLAMPEGAPYAARSLMLSGPNEDPQGKVREAVKVLESSGGPVAAQALSRFLAEGLAEASPAQAKWRDWLRLRAARALWRVDPVLAAARFHELAQSVDHAPIGLYAGAMAEQTWAVEMADDALGTPAGLTGDRLLSAAVASLARMGGPRAKAGLEKALQRPDLSEWARAEACNGLAAWGDTGSVPQLVHELEQLNASKSATWERVAIAARALGLLARRAPPEARRKAAGALAVTLGAPAASAEPVRRCAYRACAMLADASIAPALAQAWRAGRTPRAELALAIAACGGGPEAAEAVKALIASGKATDLEMAALANSRLPEPQRVTRELRAAANAHASPLVRERVTQLIEWLDQSDAADAAWLDVGGPWVPAGPRLREGDGVKVQAMGYTAYRLYTGRIPDLESSGERAMDIESAEGRHGGVTELRHGGVNVRIGRQELQQPLSADTVYTAQFAAEPLARLMLDEFGEGEDIPLFYPGDTSVPWHYAGLVLVRVVAAR